MGVAFGMFDHGVQNFDKFSNRMPFPATTMVGDNNANITDVLGLEQFFRFG